MENNTIKNHGNIVFRSKILIALFMMYFFLLFEPADALADSRNKPNKGSSFSVRVEDNLLTVKAQDITLVKVLREIAHQASIKIVVDGRTAEEVLSADFSGIPLEKGLKRLTPDMSFAFIYGPKTAETGEPKIREIIIYSGTGESTMKTTDPSMVAPKKPVPAMVNETSPESLLEALKDEDPMVRKNAAKQLPALKKDERIIKHLTEFLLSDEDEDVKVRVAGALGEFMDPSVEVSFIKAMGQIGGEKVIPLLKEALRSEDEAVRTAAAEVLEGIIEQPVTIHQDVSPSTP
jgi:hypothetical protein